MFNVTILFKSGHKESFLAETFEVNQLGGSIRSIQWTGVPGLQIMYINIESIDFISCTEASSGDPK